MTDRATWLRTLAKVRAGPGDAVTGSCPNCACDRLHARYIADRESRLGYTLLWCDACLQGISVSRAKAPEDMPIWPLEDPASTVGVPDFQRKE
ncbi:hypothetical protein [Actinoallomurus rhizosphaericola]|uniref:hypothetical protein n=1 Tax=Actinoallomurus rhizosphaericola TaxID=2952536 RepID=UPI002091EC03|nr:hypothetical protein [Actinoallomurus rhizosphaericola]MCO5998656.1 hypothetical protein [Actinoallomurus rhizosphaericola]